MIIAEINTDKGKITAELYFDKVPMTVANFVGLAEGTIDNDAVIEGQPYFDGLTFHRVVPDFVIQGGDPVGSGAGGPGYRFPDEFHPELRHDKPGILSMANAGPGTNGSQFFITHTATPHLDDRHSVFGCVTEGMKVVNSIQQGDKIKSVKILRNSPEAENFKPDTESFKDMIRTSLKEKEELEKKRQEAQEKLLEEKYPNAVTTDSGLKYVVEKDGEGETPEKGAQVKAHYAGFLTNGMKFDSSYDRNEPLSFNVGVKQVIAGWDEALMGMKKGEKRTLIIPSHLGYGKQGAGGVIPPNATLIFEVELIDFKNN